MKVSKSLNLVIPIERGTRKVEDAEGKDEEVPIVHAYVHATPIGSEVFDRYFGVIAKTYAAIYGGGLGWMAGPRVAMKLLIKAAKDAGEWEGDDGVEKGLCAEMVRLANAVMPTAAGWQTIPYEEARKSLEPYEVSEVDNALAFFTVASCMHRRQELGEVLTAVSEIWKSAIVSSNATEFSNSLPTSTETGSSGAKAAA